jgi:hypothetical protein
MMLNRFLIGALLVLLAYSVMHYFSIDNFVSISEPIRRGEMNVSSSGPGSPNVSPPPMPTRITPQPEARDPYDSVDSTADAPEQMRFPERSFSPGLIPVETENHINSGVAGKLANTPQAVQEFSSESITNGGVFFGNVSAIENDNPNYSSF